MFIEISPFSLQRILNISVARKDIFRRVFIYDENSQYHILRILKKVGSTTYRRTESIASDICVEDGLMPESSLLEEY